MDDFAAGAREVGAKIGVAYRENVARTIYDGTWEKYEAQFEAFAAASRYFVTNGPLNHEPVMAFDSMHDGRFGIQSIVAAAAHADLFDVHLELADSPGDGVDIRQFVDHIEPDPLANPSCAQGASLVDRDGDGLADSYDMLLSDVVPCWRVIARPNLDVAEPGTYRGALRVKTEQALMHELPIAFVVPGEATPTSEIFLDGFEGGSICAGSAFLGTDSACA